MPSKGLAAVSLSQFGVTWTFDRDYTTGQFANGDYYVVGEPNVLKLTVLVAKIAINILLTIT